MGVIELTSTLRDEAAAVVTELQRRGIGIYIVSGDRAETTRHVADTLGIDRVFAEVLPKQKAET